MTIKTLIAVIAFVSFISCKPNSRQNSPVNDTPQALTNTTTSYDIVKKRGYEDLIESLYSELVNKDADLKNIEGLIDTLNTTRGDSTHAFLEFDQKNQAYFNSAKTHSATIKDSVLREKITKLIANNLSVYNNRISQHSQLLHLIDTNNSTINDLHLALKIVTTLPVIGKYQKDHLPDTRSLNNLIKQQNHVIKLADTILKK